MDPSADTDPSPGEERSVAAAPSDGALPWPRWVDLAVLVALTVAIRLPAVFAQRGLTFDDGNFALSALAMRHGEVPFRDVFSSQGPLFLPVVYAGDLIGFQTMHSPRLSAVVSGVVAVVAMYFAATRLRDRLGGLVAAGLLAVSGAFAWVSGPIAADGPALAFAMLGVAFAVRLRDEPSWWASIATGLSVGAALSTKSLEAPVLVPVALVLLAPIAIRFRRGEGLDVPATARVVLAGASAAVIYLVVSFWFGFAEVWDQSFRYRADAAAQRDMWGTFAKICSTMWDRDLAMLFFALVAIGAAVRARGTSPRDRPDDTATPSAALLSWSWLAVTMLWLVVVVSPLWRPHVAAVAVPLALVIGVFRPTAKITAVAALLAVPLVFIQLDGLIVPKKLSDRDRVITEVLQTLPEGTLVLSDEPGVIWWSGLRAPGDLVDSSVLRREQGRYTRQSLLDDAADSEVCAVVMASKERFGAFDGLRSELERIGFTAVDEPALRTDDGSVLYVREDCTAASG